MKKFLVIFLSIAFVLCGCGKSGTENNLTKGMTRGKVVTGNTDQTKLSDVMVELFKNSVDNENNTVMSPLSIMMALGMTENGADSDTLAEFEKMTGCSIEEVNCILSKMLENTDENLSIADSIWVRDGKINVSKDFLQKVVDYYDSEVFKDEFNDETIAAINKWVSEKTDGMIDKLIDELSSDAVMVLINAISFNSPWAETYNENQLSDGTFTNNKGEEQNVTFMTEKIPNYISDGNAEGFIKYYVGNRYAFVALLPDEDMTVSEYVNTLSGSKLIDMIENAKYEVSGITSMPKFTIEYGTDLNSVLQNMGLVNAFDQQNADFSKMGEASDGKVCIDKVIHKAYIEVDETGTKAAAATACIMACEGYLEEAEEYHEIILNRPFVFAIMDMENNLPVFMGTVQSIN